MAKITFTAKSSAMKLYLPVLASVLALASCSTAYKTGQTPDDVYYSPARQRDEYARVEKDDDRQYQDDEAYREDRYLRMKTSYRRYTILDDYDYYSYYGGNYYNNYYNQYLYNNWGYYNNWNISPLFYTGYSYNPYYYNPYYGKPYYSGAVFGNVQPIYNKARGTNLNTYNRNYDSYNNSNYSRGRTYTTSPNNNNNNYRNSGTNAGSFLRNTFGSSNNNSTSQPSSTSSSSGSSSSSSGSSSSGGSAPVRKF